MTIVLTGGGSGGHITPLLAVADELKIQHPGVRLVYIGERGGRLGDIATAHEAIDESRLIFAGKLRRYHGEGFKQLLDIQTLLKNIRDIFLVLIGLAQALYHLKRIKPQTIFAKGGFVCLPVGLAAAMLGIPYITHDSDAIPGLANRLVARWTKVHAVALGRELYPYPSEKTIQVGVPVSRDFKPVTDELKRQYREELQITQAEQVVFVTGGGLGALRLNDAIAVITQQLLTQFPHLYLLHATGRGQEERVQTSYDHLSEDMRRRILVKDFIRDLYRYSGAADVVVTRGSATALMEFAIQGKACIAVPNPLLTGGHQLKNAEYFKQLDSIEVVLEKDLQHNPMALLPMLSRLLRQPEERQRLAGRLAGLAQPDAAQKLAGLILKFARKGEGRGEAVS